MKLIQSPNAADLNREHGIKAYRNTSFSPERRADDDIASYVNEVLKFAEALKAKATTPAKVAEAVEQVERYRIKYIQWQQTLWSAKSRTASPIITGPAKFPVERNNKAMEAEYKKICAFLEWHEKALKAATKVVEKVGYVKPPKPEGSKTGQKVNEFDGFEVVENFDIDRVQFVFLDKPTEVERAILKSAAFKWSPSHGAWQRKLTNNAIYVSRGVISDLKEIRASLAQGGGE